MLLLSAFFITASEMRRALPDSSRVVRRDSDDYRDIRAGKKVNLGSCMKRKEKEREREHDGFITFSYARLDPR